MRSLRFALPLLLGPTLLLPAVGTAHAQQQPPLMTAPRPDDKATTDAVPSDQGISGAAPSDEMRAVAPPANRPLTTAEAQALIGKSARTKDGQTAGEIRDFVLAGPDGSIDRIVIASGGFLGIGASMVAVPASALRVGAAPRVAEPGQKPPMDVMLDLTAADVAQAPPFTYDASSRTLVGRR
ncbi:MAG TPA: PRC-barrel domain-containing protein [Azospirillum sp.]|nr:PRC-barrel domain-containing protein [Azospirillum sp.]